MFARLIWMLIPSLLAGLISGWAILAWTTAGYPVGGLVATATTLGVALLLATVRRGKHRHAAGGILSRIRAKRDVSIRNVEIEDSKDSDGIITDVESKRGSVNIEDVEIERNAEGSARDG